jgi:alpha-tubulin suppressor-like RCC1 family protein
LESKSNSQLTVSGWIGHSFFLDRQGRAYSCGLNDNGQLGLSDRDSRFIPKIIRTNGLIDKIMTISTGENTSLLTDSQGQVWSCGKKMGSQYIGPDWDMDFYTLHFMEGINSRIIDLAAGDKGSLLLDSKGRVFLLDNERTYYSEDGQLNPLEGISDIIAVAMGEGQSFLLEGYSAAVSPPEPVVLNSQGQVYGLQPGYGTPVIQKIIVTPYPIPIPGDFPIVAISAGYGHALFLNSQGKVFLLGCSLYNQKELGIPSQYQTPILVKKGLGGIPIIAISAGNHHDLLLDAQWLGATSPVGDKDKFLPLVKVTPGDWDSEMNDLDIFRL